MPADLTALAEGPARPRRRTCCATWRFPSPGWSEFLRREYLADFIAHGGTKLKLLVGTQGTSKGHLLALAAALARDEEYLTAELDAYGTRLFPLDRLYGRHVTRAVGLEKLLDAYARRQVADLGFNVNALPGRGPYLGPGGPRGPWAGGGTLRRSLPWSGSTRCFEETRPRRHVSPAGVAQAVVDRLGLFHLHRLRSRTRFAAGSGRSRSGWES